MKRRSIAVAALAVAAALGGRRRGVATTPAARRPSACVPGRRHLHGRGHRHPGDGADDLVALETRLYLPQDVTIAPDGRLFIVDWNNHRIRVRQPDGTLHIVAGTGELGPDSDDPTTDRLNHPTQVTFDATGNMVIAAWHNSRIKTIDLATGERSGRVRHRQARLRRRRRPGGDGDAGPARRGRVRPGRQHGDRRSGQRPAPQDRRGDADDQHDRGRRAVHHPGRLPGAGRRRPGHQRVHLAAAGAVGASGGAHRHRRRRATSTSPTRSTPRAQDRHRRRSSRPSRATAWSAPTGDGGPATDASLSGLADVEVGPNGDVYIADTGNGCVRVVARPTASSRPSRARAARPASRATAARRRRRKLNKPGGIALDADGNLYIADTHNQRVRVVYR